VHNFDFFERTVLLTGVKFGWKLFLQRGQFWVAFNRQIDKLDGFIEKWANTSDLKSLKGQAEALAGSQVSSDLRLLIVHQECGKITVANSDLWRIVA
jgi:hypothetical protein